MIQSFFVIAAFLSIVYSGKEDFLIMSRDRESLFKCIENYILNTDRYYEEDNLAKIVSDISARRFFEKTKPRSYFYTVDRIFYELRINNCIIFSSLIKHFHQICKTQLKNLWIIVLLLLSAQKQKIIYLKGDFWKLLKV